MNDRSPLTSSFGTLSSATLDRLMFWKLGCADSERHPAETIGTSHLTQST
jgi:hypothetical protein